MSLSFFLQKPRCFYLTISNTDSKDYEPLSFQRRDNIKLGTFVYAKTFVVLCVRIGVIFEIRKTRNINAVDAKTDVFNQKRKNSPCTLCTYCVT